MRYRDQVGTPSQKIRCWITTGTQVGPPSWNTTGSTKQHQRWGQCNNYTSALHPWESEFWDLYQQIWKRNNCKDSCRSTAATRTTSKVHHISWISVCPVLQLLKDDRSADPTGHWDQTLRGPQGGGCGGGPVFSREFPSDNVTQEIVGEVPSWDSLVDAWMLTLVIQLHWFISSVKLMNCIQVTVHLSSEMVHLWNQKRARLCGAFLFRQYHCQCASSEKACQLLFWLLIQGHQCAHLLAENMLLRTDQTTSRPKSCQSSTKLMEKVWYVGKFTTNLVTM